MAEFIYIPQQSPALQPVMNTCYSFYQWYIKIAIAGTYMLYKPMYEIFFGFLPMIVMILALHIGSSIVSFGISSIWWIHYIKIWWRLLSWEGRSLFSIFYDANPSEIDRTANRPTTSKKVRRAFFDGCSMQFDANYSIWRRRTIAMNKILMTIQNFGADTFVDCPMICAALFWFYSAILFGCSVLYFLVRIIRYKFGCLDIDEMSRRCPRNFALILCQLVGKESTGRRDGSVIPSVMGH